MADRTLGAQPPTERMPFEPTRAEPPVESVTVHGYQILGVLGRGGMAVVYKARQQTLNRLVALKMILADNGDRPEQLAAICAEAEAVARLQHPNIVHVYEVGEFQGFPYFSMEYIDGGNLATQLKGSPQPPRLAAQLLLSMAQAMAYAHQNGVIHCDLTPANILLTRPSTDSTAGESRRASDYGPVAKITDFGLSHRLDQQRSSEPSSSVTGTPQYMAPEQAAGQRHLFGPATDIYALGAILYEMLTGRPPFNGHSVLDILNQVRKAEPVLPTRLQPSVPADLETICLKCLQKDPAHRYASAQALADDLRRFLAGRPIDARPIPWWDRWCRRCRRYPVQAALAGLVVLVLVLGTAVAWYFAVQARHGESLALVYASRAQDKEREATAEMEHAHNETVLSDHHLYAASLGLAQQALKDNRFDLLLQRLAALRPTRPGAADLRDFEWHYLRNLAHLDLNTLYGHEGPIRGLAYHPAGGILASASQDGTVRLWDLTTGTALQTLKHSAPVLQVVFTDAGAHLVTLTAPVDRNGQVAPRTITLWDVSTGRPLRHLQAGAARLAAVGNHRQPERLAGKFDDNRLISPSVSASLSPTAPMAMSADGHWLACVDVDYAGQQPTTELIIWDARTGQEQVHLSHLPFICGSMAFHPDGRHLALACSDQSIHIYDRVTSSEVRSLSAPIGCRNVVFSPDGKRLAAGGASGCLKIWNTESGQLLHHLRAQSSDIVRLEFTADSRRVAAATADRSIDIWDIKTSSKTLSLRGHARSVLTLAFSPDGWRLASAGEDCTIKIWDAGSSYEHVLLGRHAAPGWKAVFSPDRRQLISASGGTDGRRQTPIGEICAWDLASGTLAWTLPAPAPIYDLAISTDGRQLASADVDGSVWLWDVSRKQTLRRLDGHTGAVNAVALSVEGLLASGGADHSIRVWAKESDREVFILSGHQDSVLGVAFSPDGSRLASASLDRTICIWDMRTGAVIRVIRGRSIGWTSVAFSSDGRRLAASAMDGTGTVWDSDTGDALLDLRGHTARNHSLVFSPNSRRLVSTSLDGTIKIWDAFTGQELLSLAVPSSEMPDATWTNAAFSPDGQQLAAIRSDGGVYLWTAAEPTAETFAHRQARGLVSYLFSQSLSRSEVLRRIESDRTISDMVRGKARDFAGHFPENPAPSR